VVATSSTLAERVWHSPCGCQLSLRPAPVSCLCGRASGVGHLALSFPTTRPSRADAPRGMHVHTSYNTTCAVIASSTTSVRALRSDGEITSQLKFSPAVPLRSRPNLTATRNRHPISSNINLAVSLPGCRVLTLGCRSDTLRLFTSSPTNRSHPTAAHCTRTTPHHPRDPNLLCLACLRVR
jgi:hypothetical protein